MPELIPAEPGSLDWLAARRAGVTATDIVTIIGLSHYDSPYSLYWRKLGQVPEPEDNPRWQLGKALEPYIKGLWSDAADDTPFKSGLYRSSARSWQTATPDSILRDEGFRIAGVLECKTWADADRHAWGQGQVFDDDGTLLVHDAQIPPAVRAQVLWQMDVMDVAAGHVGVVFLPSGEFRSYTIEHWEDCCTPDHGCADDTGLCEECSVCIDLGAMRAAGEEFMARLRLELPPPDPDSSLATLAAVRARFARVPAKQAEIDKEDWIAFESACDHLDAWKEGKREAEVRLREQAGEAAELCVDGQVVARRIISDATVKEHVRHQDYLRRVKQQGDDDE